MAVKPRLSKPKLPRGTARPAAAFAPLKPQAVLRDIPSAPAPLPLPLPPASDAPKGRGRPASVVTNCDLVPMGNGNFRAVPRIPRDKLTITQAAMYANYSRDTIYRLYRTGFLIGEKQSPRRILIDLIGLQTHMQAVRDPAFWTPSRRARYWGVSLG